MTKGHCIDHEDHTICSARMKTDIANIKTIQSERSKQMTRRAERMDMEITRKLNTSTFYKIMGLLLTIMLAFVYAQGVLSKDIVVKLDKVATSQAVIAHALNIDLGHIGEVQPVE